MDYWDYRYMVISKTTGANIHAVNRKLGVVMGTLKNLKSTGVFSDEERSKMIKQAKIACEEIKDFTGVFVRFSDLEIG